VTVVGFTGTWRGMTLEQIRAVKALLEELDPTDVHHGDCIGADENFDDLARDHGAHRVAFPGTDSRGRSPKRAYCLTEHERPAAPYLERNRAIVDSSDYLVACPGEFVERTRSGTWSTVRYARGRCWTYLVTPDGAVTVTSPLRESEATS